MIHPEGDFLQCEKGQKLSEFYCAFAYGVIKDNEKIYDDHF